MTYKYEDQEFNLKLGYKVLQITDCIDTMDVKLDFESYDEAIEFRKYNVKDIMLDLNLKNKQNQIILGFLNEQLVDGNWVLLIHLIKKDLACQMSSLSLLN